MQGDKVLALHAAKQDPYTTYGFPRLPGMFSEERVQEQTTHSWVWPTNYFININILYTYSLYNIYL